MGKRNLIKYCNENGYIVRYSGRYKSWHITPFTPKIDIISIRSMFDYYNIKFTYSNI